MVIIERIMFPWLRLQIVLPRSASMVVQVSCAAVHGSACSLTHGMASARPARYEAPAPPLTPASSQTARIIIL